MVTPALKQPECPECGTILLKRARFCHACGWDSRNPAAGVAPAAVAASAYGRPRWKRRTMAGFTLITVALVLWLLLSPGSAGSEDVTVGAAAPDFTLQTPDGGEISLSSLRGQYVVLNFWATWCPPCRNEMPALQAAHEKYGGQGLVVLGVNLDESPVTIRAFADRVGVTFPIVMDAGLKVTNLYRIIPLPTTYFIDRDGIVRDRKLGEMSAEEVDSRVRKLMGPAAGG